MENNFFGILACPVFVSVDGAEYLSKMDDNGNLTPCVRPSPDPGHPPCADSVVTPPTEGRDSCLGYDYVCVDGVLIAPCEGVGGNVGICGEDSQVCENGTKKFWNQ